MATNILAEINSHLHEIRADLKVLDRRLSDVETKVDGITTEWARYKGFAGGATFVISSLVAAWGLFRDRFSGG